MKKLLFSPMSTQVPITPAMLLLVTLPLFLLFLFSAPASFPEGHVVMVKEGSTLSEIAVSLVDQGVLRSDVPFVGLVALLASGNKLQAGDYLFEEPLSVFRVAWRLRTGLHGITQIRVRIPEGFTRVQIAELLEEEIDTFDGGRFLELTRDDEGYLFPDTYFFFINVTAEEVATILRETFDERTEDLVQTFASSTDNLKDIVTLASIIEREAYDPVDQRLISGVLWNRIEIGMALQADATLYYLLGKPSSELTEEDLKTDSPYNTYINPGLPPGPISNPGLGALEAAFSPTPSEYFFYLSDSDGNTYFAEDFEMHKENKRIHLR